MKTIKLKKGLDIKIAGKASDKIVSLKAPSEVGISPVDFHGITPKVAVKVGDTVKIGTPIFFDKRHPEVKIVSPISGTITDVIRGERRRLLKIIIQNDELQTSETFEPINLNADRQTILSAVLSAGFGSMIKQRPYDVVMNPEITPKAIFVSAFDTAPLANDYSISLKGKEKAIQNGLNVLQTLTSGKVYYSINSSTSEALKNMKNVEINQFDGAHPCGNVGVQINHLSPINKDENVWSMNLQDLALLGQFAETGKIELTKTIALVGPEVSNPHYISTCIGTPIKNIITNELSDKRTLRLINGNVLSGKQTSQDSYLSIQANELSVIAEGNDVDEIFGWMMPRLNKFSMSNSIPGRFLRKTFDFDARILGGKRAFIMSGEYEKVFPMDILPEQLIKAMIAKNIDRMEQLGAYEVAPEDFALCEYVCTSKIEVQSIVREALDYMRKELE